jgi:HD-like signal output (HDOD) protein
MAFSFKRKKKPAADLNSFEIPSFSSSVITLLGKLRDPDIAVTELSADLELDPGLYIRVLKTVNAASFGLSRKVSNIQHAINLLGRSRLEALVLSVAVRNNLTEKHKSDWLNMADFWKTASIRASVAKTLAMELHPQVQCDVFTIGLLQDMAIPLLASRHGERYQSLYQCWQKEADINLAEQENNLFGIDHMSLGAHMAEAWEFPSPLISAIGDHHDMDNQELPLAVRIAAMITGDPQQHNSLNLAKRAADIFGLDQQSLSHFIDHAFNQSAELSAALS